MTDQSINSERLWSRIMDMAEIGEIPRNGSRRLAMSQDDIDGRELFLAWCKNRGYQTFYDKIGNLFVRRSGTEVSALPVVLGSHLDTQPNGGRFDGMLGVLAGLEVLETLDDHKISTRKHIDVAVWTNEEGTRFQPAMMGSGVFTGTLSLPETLATKDSNGVSVSDELIAHGYDKGLPPGNHRIGRYIELHIEQGPVLEAEEKTIGIVTGGQAIRWFNVTLQGEETHAGPVPMASRKDPVPALARIIDLVFQIAEVDMASRATIGEIDTFPSSINVVPGQIQVSVDLRSPDESVLENMQQRFLEGIQTIAKANKHLKIEANCIWHSAVVQFDKDMVDAVRGAALKRDYAAMEIVSGAGHDAFNLARIAPTTMVFIPCKDGISHNEREYASPEHVEAGANVLLDTALQFAGKIVSAAQDANAGERV
ncbi:N-carbamoyl-L-amino acid hydrolase [Roseovarius albus]|uniref:N-carbamoyl-L-amino acid hydrolase n=1 Tax=Roseovarius albus TaxID=1247867 RepID=A0A1X7A3V9_9RHOB|nr:Zn-dependent hydrolase [Roseovarius albus]SLN69844.1 N-carbamoyl-L-amino acid hydrolase [Roseovarius albus]